MENSLLFIAALGFLTIHLSSATNIRASVIKKYGENTWMAIFAMLALGFFVWMSYEYFYAEVTEDLWYMPDWWLWVNAVIMLISMIFMIVGAIPAQSGKVGVGLRAITRHPSNWGTALFAATHMITNSNAESFMFFGSFLGVGVIGTYLLDRRKTREGDKKWLELVAVTSYMPFKAMIEGRAKFSFKDVIWWQWLIAVVAWALIIELHRGYFGKYIVPL